MTDTNDEILSETQLEYFYKRAYEADGPFVASQKHVRLLIAEVRRLRAIKVDRPDRMDVIEAFMAGADYMADHSDLVDRGNGTEIKWPEGAEAAADAWAQKVGAEHRDTGAGDLEAIRHRITLLTLASGLPDAVWSELCRLGSEMSKLIAKVNG